MSKVAVAAGGDRYTNILSALELITDELDLSGRRSVVIKPNFVSIIHPLAATHVDALHAVLEFLRGRGVQDIVIAEGAASEDTMEGFANYGYTELAKEYGARLVDLNRDQGVPLTVYDWRLRPITIHLAKTIVESDFRISVTPPKTHDTVIVTASLKNMIMGSPINRSAPGKHHLQRIRQVFSKWVPAQSQSANMINPKIMPLVRRFYKSDKIMVHQGFPLANLNLLLLAQAAAPHLSVVDGFLAMEGPGPVLGSPVDLGIALASTDCVAADSLAAYVMGFDSRDIGYLTYCAQCGLGTLDMDQMQIVGEDIKMYRRIFEPHPTYGQQLNWADPRVVAIVERFARGR